MQQGELSHQMMGYDRASTMFSPDGRLLQVEYAKKTVKQGTSALGITCKDGVILLADKRIIEKLVVSATIEKVFQIDDNIAAVAAGIVSDARILIEKAQVMAQQHRVTYDETMDAYSLVKEICNIKQQFTQYGGARPFGVSLLIAGVNSRPRLFLTDPTGIYWEYKATAIGEAEDELKEILEKEYKDVMTLDDGMRLGISALKRVLGKDFNLERLDGCIINMTDKKFKKITKEDLRKYTK
ncbi:archaeal proteasome endopeptidase complex subunit alpha [Candidatus Woesearchaeota archaeon]|nr:archaeal proteasome endopeptidase complex subunit alpha [Candidatus Woesearchaeota archaeon]